MRKEITNYEIELNGDIANITNLGKPCGCGVIGIDSALEAIFAMENLTKEDWLICEDSIVYIVDRI